MGLCILFLWLGAAGSTLMAEGTTNAAPANPPPVAADHEDFGHYLASHQKDLAPFFKKHGDELISQMTPLLLGLFGRILLISLLAGWAIDVLLGRCFSAFFAPIYAKLKRAFVYATGQLVSSGIIVVLLGLAVIFSAGLFHSLSVVLFFAVLLILAGMAIQTGWVVYLYRTNVLVSASFYLLVFSVHTLTVVLVAAPFFGSKAADLVTNFVDQNLTPKLESEIKDMKHDLATVSAARDEAKAKSADAQSRLTQAQSDQAQLQKEIEEKKNSDIYIFSQIMKVRAGGDLTAAHHQLTDFLAKFSSSPLTTAAQAQLTQVDGELAAREAQKKQAEADAAVAAAQARADLLARAGKGEVTLSEMRQALIGKTPAEVSALFGTPSETASNRWGYGRLMVFNPLTNEKFGLTVNFNAGIVQGVDYYYQVGGGK